MKSISYETAAVLNLGSVDRYQEVRKLGWGKKITNCILKPYFSIIGFLCNKINIYIYKIHIVLQRKPIIYIYLS
jgi:hypothetical protein